MSTLAAIALFLWVVVSFILFAILTYPHKAKR